MVMKEEIKKRTKDFAIAVIAMTEELPRKNSTFAITNQIKDLLPLSEQIIDQLYAEDLKLNL